MVNFIVALALVCAVATAHMVGLGVVSPDQVVSAVVQNSKNADGSQDIAIDVTDAFVDQRGNDHLFQVNVTLEVAENVVSFNGQPVTLNQLSSLRLSAMLYEKIRGTGEIVGQRPVSALIVVSVLTAPNTIDVQEIVREIDGMRIAAIVVQQAIVQTDINGTEVQRIVGAIAIAKSRLNVLPPATPADSEPASSPHSPNSPDSPNSPNSPDSPMGDGHDGPHHGCHLCRWYRRQSFGVRVLVAAGVTFLAILVLYVLFRCCARLCTGARRRSVYLGNVKMHYEPLATDDKKPLIV